MGQEVLAVLLAWLCLGAITCYPSDTHLNIHLQRSISSDTVQYCGAQLATAISIVCKGNYNTLNNVMMNQKRNDQRTETYPFKRREEAHAFIRGRTRRRRGVSDECCKKPCSYEELKTFCAPTSPYR